MAKSKKKSKEYERTNSKSNSDQKVTMAALEALSSSDEDEMPPEETWGNDAKALKKAIESGVFDKLLQNGRCNEDEDEDGEESIEEVVLDDNEDEVVEHDAGSSENSDGAEGNDSEDDDASENSPLQQKERKDMTGKEYSPDEISSGDDDSKEGRDAVENKHVFEDEGQLEDNDEENVKSTEEYKSKLDQIRESNNVSLKALRVVTDALKNEKKGWPWAETFDIMPPTPLPFGKMAASDVEPVSVHDDLKRELAFYDNALEAVIEAKRKCAEESIPFSRPDDFFAEMVKTDEHMARVKDRLIFETKKMDAVAQRKSNKEQKLRSKEAQANKVAEKSKRKKEHFKQVEKWAQSAAANRGRKLDDDDGYLRSMNNNQNGPPKSKKRQLADKKYGHGGKRGRFKQNDPKDLNDMSGFNFKGNFPGMGTKKTGSGSNRKGKRARDASRRR